jgi:hypothetical protein
VLTTSFFHYITIKTASSNAALYLLSVPLWPITIHFGQQAATSAKWYKNTDSLLIPQFAIGLGPLNMCFGAIRCEDIVTKKARIQGIFILYENFLIKG